MITGCRGGVAAPDGFAELPAVNLNGVSLGLHQFARDVSSGHHDVRFIGCCMVAFEVESEKDGRRKFCVFRDVKQHDE